MPVPTYDKFIEPILRYLAAHPDGALARDTHEAVAAQFQLSPEDRAERLPSGMQPVYKNRAGWGHDRLKRAGLSNSPRRGFWKLTEKGVEFVKNHPTTLDAQVIEDLAMGYMDVRLRERSPADRPVSVVSAQADSHVPLVQSPDDRLGTALAELRNTARQELLDVLANVSPTYFETIVLDLLHRMGYGASRDDLQRVGGSGDGGIDGVISLDRLGLERVYVQAKRWQSSVGRPEIQAFYGALAGQRANKGVFITTSSYSPQALDFAKSVEKIVLVDGARLADLMIDYEVGITSRTIKIPKLDSDYFDEEST